MAGHRLGALEGVGAGTSPPFQCTTPPMHPPPRGAPDASHGTLGQADNSSVSWHIELRALSTAVAGAVGATCGEANLTHCGLGVVPPPPLKSPPPWGGTVTLAQKAQEILGAEGAKEFLQGTEGAKANLHCDTMVQFGGAPPPPPKGGTVTL